ncbi:MAG TPA: CHAT domain-containing protein [Thermoanaerobaculia bacterium]|jgi:CHAT domain-containing protein|nr:CHAT domain-containing protein [Thermoanaerobaculia bacterium]
MNDVRPRHPEAQTMAAFIEGALAPDEIAAVAEHLKSCGDCRTVVSETARFEREEDALHAPARARRWWLLAVAAVLAAIAITLPLLRYMGTRNASPIVRLIEAAPRQHRFVEARLSGFPWAQLQAPPRGEAIPDPADLKMTGAAGEVLEKTASQHQSEARHATGVAYLLINRRNDSIAALEQAANGSNDPHAWNDLAAARFAVATQDEHPSQLPLALADADHALRLDPKSPEALFNRALILEHLGVRDQARKAWQAYLAVDGGSAWGVEARAHLRALETVSRRFDPKMLDSEPVDQLVREFPQEARTWGEGPMLASWADAEAANDPSAPAKLARVHAIADALAAFNGERLLSDAVAAIERSGSRGRAALVEGHRLYRDARVAYSKRNAGAAGTMFVHAAVLFREGGSPMAYMAAYFAAGADSDQHQAVKAQEALIRLASSIDHSRDRALAAQIQGSQAVAANVSGYWGSGIRAADAAASAFRSLGETKNAAYRDSVAASSCDMIGAGDLAWSRRIRSCAALTGPEDRERLGAILRNSAVTLERFDRNDGAAALIDLAIEEVQGDRAQLAAALTDRARLSDRSGDAATAGRFLTNAHQVAESVKDATLRATLDTSIDVAHAVAHSRTQPQEAIATLNRAIAFFAQANFRNPLPDAYLQRARAFRASGDEPAAIADYDAALREVDAERSTIGGDDLRLRFLDTATQIIEESIEVHLSRGSVTEALAIADRTRQLHETSLAAVLPASGLNVASGTAVIEYAVLRHTIDIFCVTGGQITVQKVAMERDGLAERIASFDDSIRRRAPLDQIEPEANALFKLLIAPVLSRLSSVDQIVIVPDRQLHAVPFAALYDNASSRYLAEEFTIRLAPSASAVHPEAVNGALQPALVVADPTTTRWPRLPVSLREGERIAAGYGATVLSGDAATRKRFVEAATGSALIHYAGHADSDSADSYGALLLAAEDGDSGVLASSDVALLNLSKHPLVVLAACGTFRGDSVHVGGMTSLARAFLLAGARAVAGTLWEVDDDVAAALFLKIHEHLRAGESPARAVRTAQIEMIHASDPRLRHPATWAPVELLSSI